MDAVRARCPPFRSNTYKAPEFTCVSGRLCHATAKCLECESSVFLCMWRNASNVCGAPMTPSMYYACVRVYEFQTLPCIRWSIIRPWNSNIKLKHTHIEWALGVPLQLLLVIVMWMCATSIHHWHNIPVYSPSISATYMRAHLHV